MVGKIIVVGSLVYDLIVWLPYFPRKGETLLASQFKMYAGGKGFNQAIADRRCGAQVIMIGKISADQFGDAFLALMQTESIDHAIVVQDSSTTTSLGIPMIDPQGDNSIIGVPRANTLVTLAEIISAADHIRQHHILLLQLEIPLKASLDAARIAYRAGLIVIFNPTPAIHPLPALLPHAEAGEPLIDWFIPNEVEAEMLSGMPIHTVQDAMRAGEFILSQGVGRGVVVTMGSAGVVAVLPGNHYHIPAFEVAPVDPTGAGDAFCGSFAAALSENMPLEQALRFASAAGALAVTQAGAEPSIPRQERIESFLADHA